MIYALSLLVTLFFIFFVLRGLKSWDQWMRRRLRTSSLSPVVGIFPLDQKNTLAMITWGGDEYAVILGGDRPVVLGQKKLENYSKAL